MFKVTIKIARLDPNTAMTRIRNIRGGKQVEVVKKVAGKGRYGVRGTAVHMFRGLTHPQCSALQTDQTLPPAPPPSTTPKRKPVSVFSFFFLFKLSIHTLTD